MVIGVNLDWHRTHFSVEIGCEWNKYEMDLLFLVAFKIKWNIIHLKFR